MSASQGQWIVSTYAIFLAGFLMLTGRCADIYGRFRFFVCGPRHLHRRVVSRRPGAQRHVSHRDARAAGSRGGARQSGGAGDRALDVSRGPARSRAVALWGTIGSTGIAAGCSSAACSFSISAGVPCSTSTCRLRIVILRWRRPICRATAAGARAPEARRARRVSADRGACDVRLHDRVDPGRAASARCRRSPEFVATLALFGALAFVERRALEPILPPQSVPLSRPALGRVDRAASADVVCGDHGLRVGLRATRLRLRSAASPAWRSCHRR